MSTNIIMILTAAIAAIILFRPTLLASPTWRATVTPLASIIGSGFLVAGPVLAHVAGNWAWAAMLFLCVAAYMFGAAIRFNIAHVEEMIEAGETGPILFLERASDLALAFAYFISVCYYINLFASFALKADGIVDQWTGRIIATVVIGALGLIGTLRGLRALEHVEVAAVAIKLALIAGLITALAYAAFLAFNGGTFHLAEINHDTGGERLSVLLGLIILVQGFETSRYLGNTYDRRTRIRTMIYAQGIATAIYLAFILLVTPFFPTDLPAVGGETQIIDMVASLGSAAAPLVILTALASQLSAAMADLNGAAGLVNGATRGRIPVRGGYLATALVAIAVTWSADIFEIISYASKAFVLYYGIQCVQALLATLEVKKRDILPQRIVFIAGIALAVLVLVFGTPAAA
ncbi:hypothetical protein ACU5AY_18225 [Rhizobium sp. PAMB 3174]